MSSPIIEVCLQLILFIGLSHISCIYWDTAVWLAVFWVLWMLHWDSLPTWSSTHWWGGRQWDLVLLNKSVRIGGIKYWGGSWTFRKGRLGRSESSLSENVEEVRHSGRKSISSEEDSKYKGPEAGGKQYLVLKSERQWELDHVRTCGTWQRPVDFTVWKGNGDH